MQHNDDLAIQKRLMVADDDRRPGEVFMLRIYDLLLYICHQIDHGLDKLRYDIMIDQLPSFLFHRVQPAKKKSRHSQYQSADDKIRKREDGQQESGQGPGKLLPLYPVP